MNIFTHIKSRISIMDVAREYVTLKKAGLYWKGRCPFHHERTGSFTISPHREIFYCFGCHKGGDVIEFITQAERCTPLQAAHHLAEQFSLEMPQEFVFSRTENTGQDVRQHSLVCTRAALWFYQELQTNPQAQHYLSQRGLQDSIISDFTLGYFPEARLSALLDFVKKDGFLAQDLINANLLAHGKFGLYSPFFERIVFPIKDHLGRVIGFGGRVFKDDDQRPKYYNSQDHPFFTKGHVLFGLDKAKKSIQSTHSAFLVEGYLDCIAMVQAGYTNTVATLGTACTFDHLKVVSRYAQKLYIMYDGDAAGKAAMLKLTQMSWSLNMELSITQLPRSEDPASYLQKHQNLDGIIHNSQDIFLFFITQLGIGYQNKPLQERLSLVSEFTEIIVHLDDPLKQNLLLQKAAATFDIPFAVLVRNAQNVHRQKTSKSASFQTYESGLSAEGSIPDEGVLEISVPEVSVIEQKIVAALIALDAEIRPEDQELLKKSCSPPICKIVEKMLCYNNDNQSLRLTSLLESLEPSEREIFARLIMLGEESQKIDLQDLLQTLWKKEWKMIASDVKMRLKQAEASGNQVSIMAITEEFGELKKKMREKGIL